MTTTQPCMVMVEVKGQPYPLQVKVPCGEPVAELGPCKKRNCGARAGAVIHNGKGTIGHTYEPTLIHVTLGLCIKCGGKESGWRHHPEEATSGFSCTYAPTLTEGADVGHRAQR